MNVLFTNVLCNQKEVKINGRNELRLNNCTCYDCSSAHCGRKLTLRRQESRKYHIHKRKQTEPMLLNAVQVRYRQPPKVQPIFHELPHLPYVQWMQEYTPYLCMLSDSSILPCKYIHSCIFCFYFLFRLSIELEFSVLNFIIKNCILNY